MLMRNARQHGVPLTSTVVSDIKIPWPVSRPGYWAHEMSGLTDGRHGNQCERQLASVDPVMIWGTPIPRSIDTCHIPPHAP